MTFLVKKEFLLHRTVLIFQHTVNSRACNHQNTVVSQPYKSAGKKAQLLSGDGYISVCVGVYKSAGKKAQLLSGDGYISVCVGV